MMDEYFRLQLGLAAREPELWQWTAREVAELIEEVERDYLHITKRREGHQGVG